MVRQSFSHKHRMVRRRARASIPGRGEVGPSLLESQRHNVAAQLALILPMREVRVPDADTKRGKILRYLQQGGSLTPLEALNLFGCLSLSQRIGEFERDGWPIKADPFKTPGGATVARYYMGQRA